MIIFMGVAGAGKSMQGKMLADAVGLPWVSTGEFLRMLTSGDRRKQMLAGKLLSDAEIITLVQKIFAVVDTEHEFVLDGFPRTLRQADWLLTQVKHEQLNITAVVDLEINQKVVEDRLLNRGRLDDTEEAIVERFREHAELTLPIIDEFRQAGIPVHQVDGDGKPQEIHRIIMNKLNLA